MLSITDTDNNLLFEGDGISRTFSINGKMSVPYCSTLLVVEDNTEMIVFKSAYNFDTWAAAKIDELTINGESVDRSNIVETFDKISNANCGTSSGDIGDITATCDTTIIEQKIDDLTAKIEKLDVYVDVSNLEEKVDSLVTFMNNMSCALDGINGEDICTYLTCDEADIIDRINGESACK